jgi:hypothetical protein
MTGKHDIEARLDRSLRHQIDVPRLDRRFDAAVWARIEAAEAPATNPRVPAESTRARNASRWLAISNLTGVLVTLGVVSYFVLRTYGGIDLSMDLAAPAGLDVAVPMIPDVMVTQVMAVLGQVLGLAAVLFGLSFTSVGRRLRASFS